MIIRKAVPADSKAIKSLIALYPQHLLQKFIPRISDFFVAEIDGQVVGCCALEVYSKRLAEVRSLSVKKSHQGQGAAKRLIKAVLKEARKRKVVEVLTITGAVSLFERQGFRTFNKEKIALFKVFKY